MSELWPHWLRLGWLLVLPLLVWLCWQLWHRPHRSGRWQALTFERRAKIILDVGSVSGKRDGVCGTSGSAS